MMTEFTSYRPGKTAPVDPGLAQAALRQAQWEAEKHPENPRAWAGLTRAFLDADQLPEALLAFQRLYDIWRRHPQDASLLQSEQRFLAFLEASPSGQSQLSEAVATDPENLLLHHLHGVWLAKRGDHEAAEPALKRALASDPPMASTHYWLGVGAQRRDRFDEAWRHWEACLALDPTHQAARAGVEHLTLTRPTAESAVVPHQPTLLLSACLIVKDEAANLPRCLASLAGVVDEIVVVDTGSSDDTVAIAERHGAKVGHFDWCDDFSAARNASLDLATGDWVLVVDADEELVVTDPQAFRRTLAEEQTRAYRMPIENVGAHARTESRYVSSPRCFRRFPGVRFTGRLHEDIWPFLREVGWEPGLLAGVAIRHHGYTPEAVEAKDKLSRNLRLARRMVEEQGKNPQAWYHLASTGWLCGDHDVVAEAIAQVRRLRDYGRELEPSHARGFLLLEGRFHAQQGRHDQALTSFAEGLAKHPGYAELHYERGRLRVVLGDAAGAIADFEACLAAREQGGAIGAREGISGYLAHMELAELLIAAGRTAEAQDHMRAASEDPACPPEEAASLRVLLGRLEPAGTAVVSVPPVAEGPLDRAEAHLDAGEHEQALEAASEAIALDAGQPEAWSCLGRVLAVMGQPHWADRALSAALQLAPDLAEVRRARMAIRRQRPEAPLSPARAESLESLFQALQPTVSACLIVRDEAASLANCLTSLEGLADEIVVVAMGAAGDTAAIAERHGAKVGRLDGRDDLSAARDAGFDLATADWVLFVDADERVQLDDREAWLRALRCREAGAYRLSHDDEGAPSRLFQRRPHEARSLPARACEGLRVVRVAPAPAAPSASRRADLIAALERNPRNPEAFLALAHDFFQEGALDKALLATGQAIELDAGVTAAYHLLGIVLDALGQPRWAEQAFRTVLTLDPDHPTASQCRLACREKPTTEELPEAQAAQLGRLLSRVRPTVSACLIVKDEAANLPRCLASLEGVVDEVVVVDTGSGDDTVAIAERHGAKVGRFDWCDDFSAARNASLDLATGDWVLVIDADEELVVSDHQDLLRALRRRVPGGYVARLIDVGADGQPELESHVLRLFQRQPGLQFQGRLHEGVNAAMAELGWPVEPTEAFSFRHHGYRPDVVADRDKVARNLAIARRQVEEHPGDPVAWFQLGRACAQAEQVSEAFDAFLRVASLPGWEEALTPMRWAIYVRLLQDVLCRLDRHEDAERLLSEALARIPGYPEFLFERGKLRVRRGDMAGARQDFEACLQADGRSFPLLMREGVTSHFPRQALAALDAHAARAGSGELR